MLQTTTTTTQDLPKLPKGIVSENSSGGLRRGVVAERGIRGDLSATRSVRTRPLVDPRLWCWSQQQQLHEAEIWRSITSHQHHIIRHHQPSLFIVAAVLTSTENKKHSETSNSARLIKTIVRTQRLYDHHCLVCDATS